MKLGIGLAPAVLASSLAVASLAAPGAASAQVWVDGARRSCDVACSGAGMAPLASGTFSNGENFYMCSANPRGQGYRGGFNLRPDWSNACHVGFDGREQVETSYYCLCAPAAGQPAGVVLGAQPKPPAFAPQPAPPPVVIVQEREEPQGGRRINIDEATFGLNRGLPRGNATAHVTRWCDRARDVCDYTVDPAAFGAAADAPSDFTVRYHCGDDGRPKVAQTNVRGVMGQLVLSCP